MNRRAYFKTRKIAEDFARTILMMQRPALCRDCAGGVVVRWWKL